MAVDVLSNLPPDPPAGFLALSEDEKEVRGRYFLMAYAMGASVEYAWFHALNAEPVHTAEMKAIVGDTDDEQIDEALRLRDVPGRPVLDWQPTT